LLHCAPASLQHFAFDRVQSGRGPGGVLQGIEKVAERTAHEVYLCVCKVESREQMQSLVRASRGAKRLLVQFSDFEIAGQCDFGLGKKWRDFGLI